MPSHNIPAIACVVRVMEAAWPITRIDLANEIVENKNLVKLVNRTGIGTGFARNRAWT
jgi:hypothetical protein